MPTGFYNWCFQLRYFPSSLAGTQEAIYMFTGDSLTPAAIRSEPLVLACLCLRSRVRGRQWNRKGFPSLQWSGGSRPLLSPSHTPSSAGAPATPLGVHMPSCTKSLTASLPCREAGIFKDLSIRRDANRMNLKREKCQHQAFWTMNLRRTGGSCPNLLPPRAHLLCKIWHRAPSPNSTSTWVRWNFFNIN